MKKYAWLILFLIVIRTNIVASADELGDKEQFMVNWLDMVCSTELDKKEIKYIGEKNEQYWFLTPLDANCRYTGPYSNFWTIYKKDMVQ